ncbi:Hypothetical_protein [Hexamita inflata]|uniref:Hypothetical_protein n=1 Tax=Hexamita inflata TaxID=28002 RepID=A0AA86P489_9EUKA|nr:Hypothetical protein HINF_LOCUS19602 [Hexamita inflata]
MSSNLFSSIGKESSLNEKRDYSYTGVFTSVNTTQVQILQEEPQTPTVAPVQPVDNCSSHNIDKIKQKLREEYQTYISSGNDRVAFFEEFLIAMDTYCHVIYVPKNTTPQNQVLDVSVN